ncbi:efflux RND transporter periplasmic adaptor subunit [Oculatella sp. LEGE 06141]|uniref:efflux RND transporter periplasmic adaptor subunit n=1 Tax=Oculatella sp. LEGE 06141 TaxID=1828648 RepID=UPI00187E6DE5|nr:efflux RND transporter periplasmic adaptor subunit [Oculatella sp. LEGE 06141]MBE9179412.1 efflux RND transporter periplasmic adaptor subunit [Oculatella sp. LEGE 06141]
MSVQLPLIGKVRRPLPWIVGLIGAGLIGTGTVTYLVRSQSATVDISALTVPVETRALTVRIGASGTVQPVQTVNISPKNAGILRELYVEQGDRVTQGQVLARMESDDIAAEITQARARVAQAQANLDQVRSGNRPEEIAQAQAGVEQAEAVVVEGEARLNLAEERVRRNRALQQEGAISQDDLDQVLNEAETARASVEQSRARLREARQTLSLQRSGSRSEDVASAEAQLQEAIGSLEAVQVRLEDTVIRAPFAGIITQKYATEGAFVTPTTSASEASSATSTAIVAVASGLEVLAEVPEVDVEQIQPGQAVEVVADAFQDQVFQGRVRRVAPEAVVEQNVTSFRVRVDLLTGENVLRSGMNVDVTFLGDDVADALVVPTVAIVTQEGETGVLIPDDDNRPRFEPVTIGFAVGDQTQILEGVEPGDRVFIDLPPGQSLENLMFRRNQRDE